MELEVTIRELLSRGGCELVLLGWCERGQQAGDFLHRMSDLGEVCASLRRRAQDFSSSLHFAKLVGEIVRKFPREARPQRLVLLEALDCNTTFFAKIAASKAQRL